MIRKSEYYELTDRYLDNEMSQAEVRDYELHLGFDSDLTEELTIQTDVMQAVSESEVMSLRANLSQVMQEGQEKEIYQVLNSFSFGLSEEFHSLENLSKQFSSDIQNISHSFPKIHLYQHQVSGKENIHQFYKEQQETDPIAEEETFSALDEEIFKGVGIAMEERDILDLRASLSQLSQSMPSHSYSVEEIELYLSGQMDSVAREQFENDLSVNQSLSHDVHLLGEVAEACAEQDVLNLRATLAGIQKTEFQSTIRLEEIEGYIYDELSEEELASFESELSINQALSEEIELIRSVDQALGESDVMGLRDNLQSISRAISAEKQAHQSIISRVGSRRVIISSVAASLILLLGITGLLTRQSSDSQLYQKYYAAYHQSSGVSRSGELIADPLFSAAMQQFNEGRYDAAQPLFLQVLGQNPSNPVAQFYAGASLQATGDYRGAIERYQAVLEDRDNMFVEQARWYIGLCYLQTNDQKKAYQHFKKISQSQGFYQEKAQAILRKLDAES